MADVTRELERLAEDDGATFTKTPTGAWWAKDRDGIVIVRGALSRREAAVLYCEDKGLQAATPQAILERIKYEYRPYDDLPAFEEGFVAYQKKRPLDHNPYETAPARLPGREGETNGQAALRQVNAQAWDRGANAAMLYARALAFLDAPPKDVEKVQPNWLAKLLMGRC
jgi:hypothetical protein